MSIYGPLEYRENEMLGRLEEETSTLSELVKLASRKHVPVIQKNGALICISTSAYYLII